MNTSEQLSDLLPALASAIADMPDPKKNARNDHFRNRFADLGEVLDCIREPLHRHGLVLTQTVAPGDPTCLLTRVWHCKTSQWLESSVPLLLDKPTAQAQGSAITYAKRYAIKALFGMADVDDDGNTASGKGKGKGKKTAADDTEEPIGPLPFLDHVEALGRIEHARTKADLDEIAHRIHASTALRADAGAIQEVREAYAKKLDLFEAV